MRKNLPRGSTTISGQSLLKQACGWCLGISTLELLEYRVRWDVEREFLSHCSRYSWQPARHVADKRPSGLKSVVSGPSGGTYATRRYSTLMIPPIGLFVPIFPRWYCSIIVMNFYSNEYPRYFDRRNLKSFKRDTKDGTQPLLSSQP